MVKYKPIVGHVYSALKTEHFQLTLHNTVFLKQDIQEHKYFILFNSLLSSRNAITFGYGKTAR